MMATGWRFSLRFGHVQRKRSSAFPIRTLVIAAAGACAIRSARTFIFQEKHISVNGRLFGARHTAVSPVRAQSTEVQVENPLLDYSSLPRFHAIETSHVEPAVTSVLGNLREEFKKFEGLLPAAPATFEATVESLEKLQFPLEYSWGVVSHLNNVKNSDDLRKAYQACQPEVVKASMELGQSRPVFDALSRLDVHHLSESQQRVVSSSIRSMRLSGVNLDGEAKKEFNDITLRLSELSTKFRNNLLDATKAFELILSDKADVAGLPESVLAEAAQSYAKAEAGKRKASNPDSAEEVKADPENGPWRLTLDMPSYLPAMKFLKSSDIREKLYRANIARASSGDIDNGPLIEEILKLRKKASNLLGFSNFAEKSLASKMAPNVDAVSALTVQLFEKARPAGDRELKELREFAASKGYKGDLKLWDTTYWSERLKEERYSYDEEALRPYFSLPKVLEGLFGIASKLFGITIVQDNDAAERWHPDVMFFRVIDTESQKQVASFYLDPYSRPGEKNGGAWMGDCLGRSKVIGTAPVAYLVCNGSPPVGTKPSLMTFSDAETLFHEFGHGLQHMLTHVEEGDASGIKNVEWDAVELPSQFMENWLYHKPTVDSFAVHFETGEPLPADVFEKIKGARTFMAGSIMLRQLQFGALDMELHSNYDPDASESPIEVQQRIAKKYALLQPLEEDRFLCSFAHIFAGGYAAGYYSYKWAEVLSADAFAAFEEAGLDDTEALAATGRRFRATVLGCGGSRHPSDVYRDFRGKDATVDALLRHNGLI
jgi:oligopeptidase A